MGPFPRPDVVVSVYVFDDEVSTVIAMLLMCFLSQLDCEGNDCARVVLEQIELCKVDFGMVLDQFLKVVGCCLVKFWGRQSDDNASRICA